MALNLMLQGTMSNAGKRLLAAALCRIFKQDGYRVAPFKSQNMALNSFITAAGGEMGRAQVVQAEAAGLAPDVRMNPILLKPTTDVGSQVIVNGQVVGNMRAMEYYRRKREFLPAVLDAYAGLDREYDVLVIEGAGSPAEINLKQDDFVNMGLAKLVDAPVLLIGDIDRGGVFAQLYGTIALLESDERARVKGTIINKFRGDRAILEPGLRQLEALCGVPVAGVVPYTRVDIDEEDSLTERFSRTAGRKLLDLAVIRLPRISNFTDFSPFERYANVSLRYISSVGELGTPDMKLPIQYALYYPERRFLAGDRLDFAKLAQITFEAPDFENFHGLSLAYKAGRRGGTLPTVFNAANERAVQKFLDREIGYLTITDMIEAAMEHHTVKENPTVEEILAAEQETYDFIESRW